jgi:hypothetical protein
MALAALPPCLPLLSQPPLCSAQAIQISGRSASVQGNHYIPRNHPCIWRRQSPTYSMTACCHNGQCGNGRFAGNGVLLPWPLAVDLQAYATRTGLCGPYLVAGVPMYLSWCTAWLTDHRVFAQAQLRGGMERVQEMKRDAAALLRHLGHAEALLQDGMRASANWAGLLRAHRNRWGPACSLLSAHCTLARAAIGRQGAPLQGHGYRSRPEPFHGSAHVLTSCQSPANAGPAQGPLGQAVGLRAATGQLAYQRTRPSRPAWNGPINTSARLFLIKAFANGGLRAQEVRVCSPWHSATNLRYILWWRRRPKMLTDIPPSVRGTSPSGLPFQLAWLAVSMARTEHGSH